MDRYGKSRMKEHASRQLPLLMLVVLAVSGGVVLGRSDLLRQPSAQAQGQPGQEQGVKDIREKFEELNKQIDRLLEDIHQGQVDNPKTMSERILELVRGKLEIMRAFPNVLGQSFETWETGFELIDDSLTKANVATSDASVDKRNLTGEELTEIASTIKLAKETKEDLEKKLPGK